MRYALRLLAGLAFFAFSPLVLEAQRSVFVVRHAEKESPANEPSVPLSGAGKARAIRLAEMLRGIGITAIYVTDTVRARDTAAPLASAIERPIQIYSKVEVLAELLKRESQAVILVVGHSNTVPALLAALGVPEKIQIGDGEYDNLFVVVPGAAASPILLRLKY